MRSSLQKRFPGRPESLPATIPMGLKIIVLDLAGHMRTKTAISTGLLLWMLLIPLPGFFLLAETGPPGILEQEGVRVEIQEDVSDVPDLRVFLARFVNTTGEDRSLKGSLLLYSGPVNGVPETRCTVFMELKPEQSVSRKILCRGNQIKTWSFSIDRVYPFTVTPTVEEPASP